jgi:hypothetical protein
MGSKGTIVWTTSTNNKWQKYLRNNTKLSEQFNAFSIYIYNKNDADYANRMQIMQIVYKLCIKN